MPFSIGGQRQRGIDERCDRSRKIRGTAIANPLRIAAIDQETRSLQDRHVAGHAGLARAELPHQFTDTMLAPISQHSKSFQPERLRESG